MFTFEEKYLINLLQDKQIYNIDNNKVDIEKLVKLISKHKLFLQFFDKINDDFSLLDVNKKIETEYFKEILFLKKIESLINIIVDIFNKNNVNYRIYKGIVTSKLLYKDNYSRYYTDIDVYIDNSEINNVIALLEQELVIYSLGENILNHEYKYYIDFLNTKFTIEFKKDNYHLLILDEKLGFDTINLNKNLIIKTFSLENTFLNSVLYYYYYTQNVIPFLYSNKIKLIYPYEIMLFLEKYIHNIKWDIVLSFAKKYKIINKIRVTIIDIQKLFKKDYSFLLKIFNKKYISNEEDDLIDYGVIKNYISILNRFVHNDQYIDFVKKNWTGEMLLGPSNKTKYKEITDIVIFNNIEFKYNVLRKNNKLEINIYNFNNLNNNIIIYLSIYAFDYNGFLIEPFIPITIYQKNGINVSNKYFLNREFGYFDEMKFASLVNKDICVELINSDVLINLYLDKFMIDIKKNIGIKFSAYVHDNDGKIIEKYNLCENYDKPKIIEE